MAKMLLKAGKIFDGESFIDADILIENDKIIAIDKSIDGGGAMQINCSGCIISSGLVDIHTHLLEMGNNSFGFPADMATILAIYVGRMVGAIRNGRRRGGLLER